MPKRRFYLSILKENRIDPSILSNFWVGPLKIFEVKGRQYAKKLEFGQTKKISLYQLFKTRICAFMTYVQFQPKGSSNSRLVLRDLRVRGHRAEASNLWISRDRSQIWATFRPKLNIGHKSTYSSFKKLVYRFFFCLAKFQLFWILASFDLKYLEKPNSEIKKKVISMQVSKTPKLLRPFVSFLWSIDLPIVYNYVFI